MIRVWQHTLSHFRVIFGYIYWIPPHIGKYYHYLSPLTQAISHLFPNQKHHHHFMGQVHGTGLAWVDKIHSEFISFYPYADGCLSQEPYQILWIRAADCVPSLWYDKKDPLVLALHAGWKGCIQHIVPKTIEHLKISRPASTSVANISVELLPHICVDHYEVSVDWVEKYQPPQDTMMWKNGRPHFDLRKYHEIEFATSPVSLSQQVQKAHTSSDFCTYSNTNLPSYRKEKQSNHMWSFIYFEPTVPETTPLLPYPEEITLSKAKEIEQTMQFLVSQTREDSFSPVSSKRG